MEKTGKRLRGIHKHFDNQYEKGTQNKYKGTKRHSGRDTGGERERERGWTHTE